MADYLVVDVISADVPTSSNASTDSYFVKLQYNGQTKFTPVKENVPRWDERIFFHRKAQVDHSGDLTLEAEVYNSVSILGKVLLSDHDFCRHSGKVAAVRHPWKGNGGALLLKAFLAGAVEVQPFLADVDELQPFLAGVDELQQHTFNTIFGHEEDNIAGQHGAIDTVLGDVVPEKINPDFEPDRLIERMQHLFVRVIKARRLPDVDANGSLDPYVEVTFGAYNKGVTKCMKRNKNPEWNETFAFSLQQYGKTPSPSVSIVVNDKDLVRDDFVGKLHFDVKEIQERSPDDKPLEPTWYQLSGEDGKQLAHASLLVAVWIGSQADEAYRHAWVSEYSPKVYETPRLWCLRVTILEIQGIPVVNDGDNVAEVFCKACLGDLVQKTRTAKRQMTSRGCYVGNEDLLFAAAEPFFEGDLKVSVIICSGTDETIIGTLTIPLASIGKPSDDDHLISPKWFELKKPGVPQLDGSVDDFNGNTSMEICLRNFLEGGYNIGHGHQGCIDDTRPADRKLWSPPIGAVHLGILRTIGLTCGDGSDRRLKLNPYCVAKYGDKWVRTRTLIDAADYALFNEQYTWDVYDIITVLNVGVFDHCMVEGSGHRKIGKVRIHLSCLETDRIYAYSYPLVVLSLSGAKKVGELQLAVKISLPSPIHMLHMYAQPTLPRMHYVQPLTDVNQYFFSERDVEEELESQAVKIMAHRLGRVEPPLRSEVVDSMFHTEGYSLWSIRKTKANYFRLMGVIAPFITFFTWFGDVRSWRDPAVTLLAHAIFVVALWFHKLVIPLVPLYGAFVTISNYRLRPRCAPYANCRLSNLDVVHDLDELEEEFDTVKSSCREEDLRMRYVRLRNLAGWVQTVTGDVATQGERIHSLVSWRDPTATATFYSFITMIAVMVYFVPFKVLMALAGFYVMRHPRFRATTPSIFANFIRRMPSKQESLF